MRSGTTILATRIPSIFSMPPPGECLSMYGEGGHFSDPVSSAGGPLRFARASFSLACSSGESCKKL